MLYEVITNSRIFESLKTQKTQLKIILTDEGDKNVRYKKLAKIV